MRRQPLELALLVEEYIRVRRRLLRVLASMDTVWIGSKSQFIKKFD